MKLLTKYNSLKGYLERFSLLQLGKLHIRTHTILSEDGTPYLHNHPFWYISIILKGSYTEQVLIKDSIKEVSFNRFSIIFGSPHKYHRIKECTFAKTLFISWKSSVKWGLKTHTTIEKPKEFITPSIKGIYTRSINNKELYCKFDNFWFMGHKDKNKASQETKLSVHQLNTWN